jgi:signal transduction histidine kinase
MINDYRVLVVDDEAQILEAYKAILMTRASGAGELSALEDELFGAPVERKPSVLLPQFTLDCATQGEEAVDRVARSVANKLPYSVIFIDARMPPGIDGITAARAIRDIDPYVIIVLVTAYSDVDLSGIVGDGMPALRFLYLAKPFQPQEITQLATALSLQWDSERAHRTELQGKNDALGKMLEDEAWLRKAAESAQRARVALFGTIGHELKTPLNAVIGFSEMMLTGTRGPINNATYQSYVEEIHAAGKTLLTAICAIMEVAQIESGAVQPEPDDTNLVEIVDSAISDNAEFARARSVSLNFARPEPSPFALRADPRQLGRAIACLLQNAIKFSQTSSEVEISLAAKADRLELRIADRGCGFAFEQVDRLLEPFSQADGHLTRRHEGLGLGLGLAKGLLELQGAYMSISSAHGQGTNVVIHFPTKVVPAKPDRQCA